MAVPTTRFAVDLQPQVQRVELEAVEAFASRLAHQVELRS